MAIYARPTNDADRLSLLHMAVATATADQAAGKNYLAPETLAEVSPLLNAFGAANETIIAARAEVGQASRAAEAAFLALREQIMRIWTDARNRVRFDDDPPTLLTFVQLPQAGHQPKPTSRSDWLQMATLVQQGAEQAMAAGFAPLADAESTATVWEAAQSALLGLTTAKSALAEAQRNRSTLRSQTDRLCTRMVEDLRYALRDLSPTDQRQVMRSYGVRFRSISISQTPPLARSLTAVPAQAEVMGWQLQPEPVPVG